MGEVYSCLSLPIRYNERRELRFTFADQRLQDLYQVSNSAHWRKYPPAAMKGFFKILQAIEAAPDERDLRALRGLHFEQLQGMRGRRGEHSMRLNDQYRLIVTLEDQPEGRTIIVHAIEDYHR